MAPPSFCATSSTSTSGADPRLVCNRSGQNKRPFWPLPGITPQIGPTSCQKQLLKSVHYTISAPFLCSQDTRPRISVYSGPRAFKRDAMSENHSQVRKLDRLRQDDTTAIADNRPNPNRRKRSPPGRIPPDCLRALPPGRTPCKAEGSRPAFLRALPQKR